LKTLLIASASNTAELHPYFLHSGLKYDTDCTCHLDLGAPSEEEEEKYVSVFAVSDTPTCLPLNTSNTSQSRGGAKR